MAFGDKAVELAILITENGKEAAAGIAETKGEVSGLGRAGSIAGKALVVGLAGAAFAAVKCSEAAEELQVNQEKLADSAHKAAHASDEQIESMNKWAEAQELAKGVTEGALLPSLTKLVNVTHNVHKAQSLASLAMDISARTGKSLDTVTQSLAKAQTGSIAGLAKYQVQTKDAAGHTLSLQQVTKELAATYNGAAAQAATTAAGKQRILSVETEQLKEKIGAGLIPIEGKLLGVVMSVVGAMSAHSGTTLAVIGAVLGLLAVVKLISVAQSLWTAATVIGTVASKAFAAGQWLVNAALDANPIGLIVIAIAALVIGLVLAYKHSETFRNIVQGAFKAVSAAAGVAVDFIRNHWQLLLAILLGPFGIVVGLIASHWDKIRAGAAIVIAWVREHWPQIKAILTGPFDTAKAVISKAWDAISSGASDVKSTVTGVFNTIAGVVQKVIDKVQALIDKIQSIPGVPGGGGGASKSGGFGVSPDGVPTGSRAPSGRVAGGELHVHLTFPGGFVGDEVKLMRTIRAGLAADRRRLAGQVVAI